MNRERNLDSGLARAKRDGRLLLADFWAPG
jgi:hypothetical protein